MVVSTFVPINHFSFASFPTTQQRNEKIKTSELVRIFNVHVCDYYDYYIKTTDEKTKRKRRNIKLPNICEYRRATGQATYFGTCGPVNLLSCMYKHKQAYIYSIIIRDCNVVRPNIVVAWTPFSRRTNTIFPLHSIWFVALWCILMFGIRFHILLMLNMVGSKNFWQIKLPKGSELGYA